MYTYAKNRSTSKYKMSVIVYMIDASLQPLLMAWHHRLQHIVLLYHLCLFQFPLFDAGSWVLAKWTSLWDVMFGQYSQDLICDFLQVLTHTDPHERPTRLSRLTCSLWCDFFFFFFWNERKLTNKNKNLHCQIGLKLVKYFNTGLCKYVPNRLNMNFKWTHFHAQLHCVK